MTTPANVALVLALLNLAALYGPFDVILMDPPWWFRAWSLLNQAKGPKYALMSFAELCALPLSSIAAENCFLVMWVTQAQVDDAIALMAALGFEFKSMGAWAKQSKTGKSWHFGTGYIFRSAAEFYVVGTRGSPKQSVRNIRNLIVAPVREHSRKPDEMYNDLEAMFPNARRLEMFARGPARPNWSVWGLEAEQPVEAAR